MGKVTNFYYYVSWFQRIKLLQHILFTVREDEEQDEEQDQDRNRNKDEDEDENENENKNEDEYEERIEN